MVIRRSISGFWIFGMVAAVFVAIFAACEWYWSTQRQWDLGNKPPGLVFSRVFGIPPPSGTYNLKVAGMSSLSGEVWMRFQVRNVPAFLAAMKRNSREPLTVSPLDLSASVPPSESEAKKDHYAQDVGWSAIYAVTHPAYYVFASNSPGHGWFGQMVVDSAQRMVYVHGGLM